MSNEISRAQARAAIQSNIDRTGQHIYAVGMGQLPKYCYTIGLSESSFGAELVLAGAACFSIDEVAEVLNDLGDAARSRALDPSRSCTASHVALAHFQKVHESWIERLLLGALDYYSPSLVTAYQVLLRPELTTIDIPDLSRAWDPEVELVWKWLEVRWSYEIPEDTAVVTNCRALRGHPITEVCHWEDDAWELVAADDEPVTKSDLRIAPFATLLAVDPSLEEVLSLPPGKAVRRDHLSARWDPWGE